MLQNKKILIAGLANKHSIAAGIARAMHAQGAELAFTYQSERLKGNVEKIAAELGSNLLFECDVASDQSIDNIRIGCYSVHVDFDLLHRWINGCFSQDINRMAKTLERII